MAETKQPRMVEKKIPSGKPFWTIGIFWLVYASQQPLYRINDIALLGTMSVILFAAARKLFPAKTVLVEAPPEPAYAGAFDIGETQRDFLERLKSADEAIENEAVSSKVRRISELSTSIFEYLAQHPEKKSDLHRFTSYYLPTVLKILDSYDKMEEQKIKGANITAAMAGIEKTLDTVSEAFAHQLNALHSADTLDVETDIAVLESLLKQEGLIGNAPDTDDAIELKL